MRIAVIGGRHRNEAPLASMAAARGHELEVQEGHTAGGGVEGVRRAVSRADLVIIVTSVNSHAAVHAARRAARQLARPVLLIQKFGTARLRRLLDALERRRELQLCMGLEPKLASEAAG